jgi:hypothetical protein
MVASTRPQERIVAQRVRTRISAMLAALLLAVAAPCHAALDLTFVDGFENGCGQLLYQQDFALVDGSAWPAPWQVAGNADVNDIQQGAARLRPGATGYSLARMKAAVTNRNIEVRFRLRMEDVTTQGVGFYVRQNGGYLTQTATHGQGYAGFVEGSFRGSPGVSVWKEDNGSEIQLAHSGAAVPPLANGTNYRVRLQVLQATPIATLLRAKLWPDTSGEPAAWDTSFTDATLVLQNVDGGLAVDSWSVLQTPATISAHTFIDDLETITLCAP